MADRITRKHLDALCARLNRITDSPMTYMDEQRNILIGHWHVSSAYGGFCLVRTSNEFGGVSQPMGQMGHQPARQVYELTHAFIKGIEFAKHGE